MATISIDQSVRERAASGTVASPQQIGGRLRVLAFVAAAVTIVAVTLSVVLPGILSPTVVYHPGSATTKAFEAGTGLHLIRVAPTGDNGLVEVQYQIVDPSNAANLLGPTHDIYPTLVDEASGRAITEAFMGHAPHPVFRLGATAFDILMDPNHVIRSGSLVTVIVGTFKLEHVPVSAS